ncbi:dioxygenase family protein [Moheibacter sediminis]|uniref:Protocatechuate 3,4-dioxygenase beta subunit n=1 Tax=Moheibacter sediminis TaxID=1434700 RepID=A0A1W2CZZ0_9FLAO|nr:intradiol ring-cleavage dioxygenase [Moheibacter sediminis]SMC90895.1 protocatechuate 3,4-dioxygenase beta subunit [Moheibacter sediminis]
MKIRIISKWVCFCSVFISCKGQIKENLQENKIVGGGCEGCELMYIGIPENISTESTSNGWTEGRQKLMIVGKVYQRDGRTAAKDIIIYYWHTDENGLYSSKINTPKDAKEHGHLRGWVKSDENGNYRIKTSRPAHYPNENMAAHIHLSIKEPQIENEYFADLYFDDDSQYLQHKKKYGKADRAGTELLRVVIDNDIQIAEHNIILGLNIPNYPEYIKSLAKSGLNIGEDQPSFIPYHAFGPDKGTQTCPVCKYGRYHGIVYFVGNRPDWESIKKWLEFLELESEKRKKYLKVYFVYGNQQDYNKSDRQYELEKLGKELNIKNTALTFVPSFSDKGTEADLNNINPEAENTFIIYKHRVIVDKFLNLKATNENFELLSTALDKTKGEYFHLSEP